MSLSQLAEVGDTGVLSADYLVCPTELEELASFIEISRIKCGNNSYL